MLQAFGTKSHKVVRVGVSALVTIDTTEPLYAFLMDMAKRVPGVHAVIDLTAAEISEDLDVCRFVVASCYHFLLAGGNLAYCVRSDQWRFVEALEHYGYCKPEVLGAVFSTAEEAVASLAV
jgi:hypothetical protein